MRASSRNELSFWRISGVDSLILGPQKEIFGKSTVYETMLEGHKFRLSKGVEATNYFLISSERAFVSVTQPAPISSRGAPNQVQKPGPVPPRQNHSMMPPSNGSNSIPTETTTGGR